MDDTNTALRPDITGAIRVVQLPIIEEQLRVLKEEVERRTADAMSLACTADTVQAVKATRAELNRQFAALEEARKSVKKQIMEPYERFEATYKGCVTDLFRSADADLKGKIDAVEGELKSICDQNLQIYFCELRDAKGLPWLEYNRAGISVDMASARAKTPKKLMDALRLFVDGVAADAKAICGMEDSAEIMAEYKATLDLSRSIATVQERKRRVEAERVAAEERARAEAERKAIAEAASVEEAFAPPVAVELPKAVQRAEDKRYELVLCVTGTEEQMRLIKQFLAINKYQYGVEKFNEIEGEKD